MHGRAAKLLADDPCGRARFIGYTRYIDPLEGQEQANAALGQLTSPLPYP